MNPSKYRWVWLWRTEKILLEKIKKDDYETTKIYIRRKEQ